MQDSSCIFCRIVSARIPARIIKQNDRAIAFLDAFPLAAGHTLVIPKSHYSKVQDMDPLDSAAVFSLLYEIIGAVESEAEASTIAIHNGRVAGQEVPHVHVHVVPRKRGDGAGPIHLMFKKPKLSSAEMDAVSARISSRLQ